MTLIKAVGRAIDREMQRQYLADQDPNCDALAAVAVMATIDWMDTHPQPETRH